MAKLKAQTPVPGRVVSADRPRTTAQPDPRLVLSTEMSPALRYRLMTGAEPSGRIAGWVQLAQGVAAPPDVAWRAHGHALITEAEAHGFVPYAQTKKRPSGPGFDRLQRNIHHEW